MVVREVLVVVVVEVVGRWWWWWYEAPQGVKEGVCALRRALGDGGRASTYVAVKITPEGMGRSWGEERKEVNNQ